MLIRYDVMLYCNKFTACNIWYSQDNESHVFSLKCTHVLYIYTKTTRYKQLITQFCQRTCAIMDINRLRSAAKPAITF